VKIWASGDWSSGSRVSSPLARSGTIAKREGCRPLGTLADTAARGLGSATPSGPAVVIAAAILATYVVLGFLDGYVVTTLWYGKHLQELGYQ
jgi:hypothetical protein